ncbi:MFS transporter [Eleftheria terrae]|uniref:MFS transporter n=1 Tax=Eleftheria terrae TaxID=1597781 RepID=UPI00263A4EC2|nr:MFS transporter [Eleftheria terrae]WKB53123.1 MFS transporter [Eleftheria terrae]
MTSAHTSSVPLRQDARTIGLIGLAHGTSHFFHLLLPPLFPWFISEFGVTWLQLGMLSSVFFVISGVGQALAGFLVDRVGARPVLFGALSCFVAAALAAASAQGYTGLVLASALAGLGNAPFHPADFTILNKRVSAARLGHAFSVHGITGNLGWAMAPLFLVGLTKFSEAHSWRLACVCAAGVAALVLAVLVWQRDAIDDRQGSWGHETRKASAAAQAEHPLAFLALPSVWLCFSFFFWSTCAMSAVQNFASPVLQQLYGLPAELTSMVVTGYMLCGAAGMVAGGFLVARVQRLELTISVTLLGGAVLLALAGSGLPGGMAAMVIACLAGLGTGLAGPSRDMLIKRAAPPGATGRVYGTVYSGLDLGFAVAAPVFGAMLDRGLLSSVFYGAGAALALSVLSAAAVGQRQRAQARRVMAQAA